MRILIVEDEPVCSRLLSSILAPYGEVITVPSAEDGWNKYLESREQNSPFELICLDLIMPKADGVEFLTILRDYEEEQGLLGEDSTRIIITSGDTDLENFYDVTAIGCSSFIAKPVNRVKLLQELCRLGLVQSEEKSKGS